MPSTRKRPAVDADGTIALAPKGQSKQRKLEGETATLAPQATSRTLKEVLVPAHETEAAVQHRNHLQTSRGPEVETTSVAKAPKPEDSECSPNLGTTSDKENVPEDDFTLSATTADQQVRNAVGRAPGLSQQSPEGVTEGRRPRRSVRRPCYIDEDPTADLIWSPTQGKKRDSLSSDYGNNTSASASTLDVSSTEGTDSSLPEQATDTASEEHVTSKQRKRGKKAAGPSTAGAGKPQNGGMSKGKLQGSSANMAKILNRPKEAAKGLDATLPPISEIDDIFADIVKKALPLGLTQALDSLNGRPIRVATMCSGTESPILALKMVQDALKSQSGSAPPLEFKHLFSAEIVAYKQAYIERNFNPPILFRDITELTDVMNDEVPFATTAYGAKVAVPTEIDMVVAGTSCVDFSRMNRHRKSLHDGGESDATWHAVLAFCKTARPGIVVIENVKNAPWDQMIGDYEKAGYISVGALLDTKNFYLPQTRQRGYLVAFDKARVLGPNGAGKKWVSLMQQLRRHASSPFTSFLLPSDNLKGRDEIRLEEPRREVDWSICEQRHLKYRVEKRVGYGRPVLHWQEGGAMSPPENWSTAFLQGQVSRVHDFLEVAVMRKALPQHGEYDMRYKHRLLDLSQNIDLSEDGTPFGVISCITPSGTFFISAEGRELRPEELLQLQGIPLDRISFTTESAHEIQDLAGNAMSSSAVGCAMLSALIVGASMLGSKHTQSRGDRDWEPAMLQITTSPSRSLTLESGCENLDLESLQRLVARAMKRCYCERDGGLSSAPIQQCIDCQHTTCVSCGGNPEHKYQQSQLLSQNRIDPQSFEDEIRSRLPLQITFSVVEDMKHLNRYVEKKNKIASQYVEMCTAQLGTVFTLARFKRTHKWSVSYLAPGATIELCMSESGFEWQMFIDPPKELAVNSPLRAVLARPVATCVVGADSFGGSWVWRVPQAHSVPASIHSKGASLSTWRSRAGMIEFIRETQPELLDIKLVTDGELAGFECVLSGRYRLLPHCGTAFDSLYKKDEADPASRPLFLFLDPTPTGDPEQDGFVFSRDAEPHPPTDEARRVIARVAASWRPWRPAKQAIITRDDTCVKATTLKLQPAPITFELKEVHNTAYFPENMACDQALGVLSCATDTGMMSRGDTVSLKDKNFVASARVLFEAMRRSQITNKWHFLNAAFVPDSCSRCAPAKPQLRWKLTSDGKTIEPFEDPRTAANYERSVKTRPASFSMTGEDGQRVDFAINFATMLHRARSRLPQSAGPVAYDWRIDTKPSAHTKAQKFRLNETKGIEPYGNDLRMSIQLFPEQLVQVAWMQLQEAGEGATITLEEVEEEKIEELGWRIQMRARALASVRGGICADHPGFGKTITSLALMQAQWMNSSSKSICKGLQTPAAGLLPSAATLVVCPGALVLQWKQEAMEKLQWGNGVIAISTIAELGKLTIKDFTTARLIVFNRAILGSSQYSDRLAALAAVPPPATEKGRAFTHWHKHAASQLPEHMEILDREGISGLATYLRTKYKSTIDSDDFTAFHPSRRLRGKEFAEAAKKGKGKASTTACKLAAAELDTSSVGTPLLEMFLFNRLVVDEFQQFETKEVAAVCEIRADKRWILSGTPPMDDCADVGRMANLLGIQLPIGGVSKAFMKPKNITKFNKNMTTFEKFDAGRQVSAESHFGRIHKLHQDFLNKYARRNIADFAHFELYEHLVPVSLDLGHRAVYTEVAHQLNSTDMRIRKTSANHDTQRDERLNEAVSISKTAEEALSRSAACRPCNSDLEELIENQKDEAKQLERQIKPAFLKAHKNESEHFSFWWERHLEHGALLDMEVIEIIKRAAEAIEQQADGEEADDDEGDEATKGRRGKGSTREYTSKFATLATKLLRSHRSLRYCKNLALANENAIKQCESVECKGKSSGNEVAVSAVCGHVVCRQCRQSNKDKNTVQCPSPACHENMHDFHLLWASKMGVPNPSKDGAKIDKAMDLLEGIQNACDQAILFVQYPEQIGDVEPALQARGIRSTIVHDRADAGSLITEFHASGDDDETTRSTVIVLNCADETAAGPNLQNANHVVFLSPLLSDTQYAYEATLAQSVARVRRHGQRKPIHVHRIVALDTIDVDILEHRERRVDALVERGAAVTRPSPLRPGVDPPAERTQLVRECGVFSLRPRSWLVGTDTDNGDASADGARVKGKNRVAGWDDFSSLVKFSRAYTENDD